MTRGKKTSAIIVAAGKGSRMKADCPKQFIEVLGKPILYYTLKAFEKSEIDEIIIVVSEEYLEYVQKEIVEKYDLKKVIKVIQGGNERYESVYNGLALLNDSNYILVHDGARPFIEVDMINRVIHEVEVCDAVIVGVKSKDTVKVVNEEGFVQMTPNRNYVWNIQTPQAFAYDLLKNAYDIIVKEKYTSITDDAMVVEYATKQPIKVIEGSYANIKITTPEDLKVECFQGL